MEALDVPSKLSFLAGFFFHILSLGDLSPVSIYSFLVGPRPGLGIHLFSGVLRPLRVAGSFGWNPKFRLQSLLGGC